MNLGIAETNCGEPGDAPENVNLCGAPDISLTNGVAKRVQQILTSDGTTRVNFLRACGILARVVAIIIGSPT